MQQVKKIFLVIFILTFFASCTEVKVPTINIIKDEAIGWKDKEICKLIYSEGLDSIKISAKIKSRGGMSSRYYKHSFAVELDSKYVLCNLPGDDDWILNANYIDKTFMRHKISYDIFMQMNPNNIASKSAFVNIKINDEYEGLYLLMEEINASKIGLDKSDTLAMLFKDPPIFHKEKLSYTQDSLNYYQQKYPKIHKSDKTFFIEQFRNFIFNSTDKDFVGEISNWIDIDNIVDWHILLLFSNNSDGIMKNFYLYKLNSEMPFRIAIWDYDHSFGRDGDNELNMMDRELNCNRSILLERLTQISETGYLKKLKKRWFELRALNVISNQNIKSHINENEKIIRNDIKYNFVKWPTNGEWYYDDNDHKEEVDLMLRFVELRINQLDDYFNSL